MTDQGPRPLRFASEGLTLRADGWGTPSGRPVLLLHGGGQTRHAWGDTAAELASRGYFAVTVDARGHGESSWDRQGRYALADFARDVENIAAGLDQPPVLVGASLGGYASIFAVGALGVDAAAVVLVDIAPRIEPVGVARIMAFMTANPAGFASVEEAADAVAAYLPHRRRPEDLSGLRKNLRLGDDGRHYWHWDPAFIEVVSRQQPGDTLTRAEEVVRALTVPTLLIRGKLSDLLSEEGVQHFLELVPHARYVDVSGAAHMVAGDVNDRFTRAVVAFLDEQQGPR